MGENSVFVSFVMQLDIPLPTLGNREFIVFSKNFAPFHSHAMEIVVNKLAVM
jgi:hypothetical protein